MTEPNKDNDRQIPESQLPHEVVAHRRLEDLGIRGGEVEASYIWAMSFVATTDAVKVIRNHLGRTPEDFQADMQIRLFKLVSEMDSFENMLRPTIRETSKRSY